MTPRSSPGSEALLPCPFCGKADVGFGRTGQKWQTVACNECGAEGPCTEIDRDLIIEKWNTRAGPAQSPASYRWRQPGNKHWIYDPTPEWIEDHKHEIDLEALYASPVTSTLQRLTIDDVPSCGQENDYRRAVPSKNRGGE